MNTKLLRFVTLALLGALAAPVAAQTFPTHDATIRRIYTLGMDSSQLEPMAHALFDSIGPRLMGSPDLKRADDWLVRMYTAWGIDAREEHSPSLEVVLLHQAIQPGTRDPEDLRSPGFVTAGRREGPGDVGPLELF